MSRPFAIVHRADSFPGHCIRCLNATDLIDLGADELPGYGVAHMCRSCFAELVDALDYVTGDRYRLTITELQKKITDLELEITLGVKPGILAPKEKTDGDPGDAGSAAAGPGGDRSGDLVRDDHAATVRDGSGEPAALDGAAAVLAAGAVRDDADGSADGDAGVDDDADELDPADRAGDELAGDVWDVLRA